MLQQRCAGLVQRSLYFHEEQSEYARDENLTMRFSLSIENTVKELIPVQQILQTYMSQETRDISLDGEVEDTTDPDVLDEHMEEPFGEPEPEPEPMMEPEPLDEMNDPQPTGLENEFKTVHGVRTRPEPVSEPIAHPSPPGTTSTYRR